MSGCFCIGPQDGQPECPCAMRSVSVVNGRYVRMQDIGPAKTEKANLGSETQKALKDAMTQALKSSNPIR